jgi:hypothetical protein
VAALALYCRRPRDPARRCRWEYLRRAGLDRNGIVAEMQAGGWEPCGSWLPFSYFKRAVVAARPAWQG